MTQQITGDIETQQNSLTRKLSKKSDTSFNEFRPDIEMGGNPRANREKGRKRAGQRGKPGTGDRGGKKKRGRPRKPATGNRRSESTGIEGYNKSTPESDWLYNRGRRGYRCSYCLKSAETHTIL